MTTKPVPKKPIYKKWWVWLIAVLAIMAVAGQFMDDVPDPAASDPEPVVTDEESADEEAQPEDEPSATVEPEPAKEPVDEPETEEAEPEDNYSDADALAEVEDYLAERADAGVVIAQTVSDVTLEGGVLRVVFDPEVGGIDMETFDFINPYDNLSEFVGTPFCFRNEEGERIRTRISEVKTSLPDGTSLGAASVGDLYEVCTGLVLD